MNRIIQYELYELLQVALSGMFIEIIARLSYIDIKIRMSYFILFTVCSVAIPSGDDLLGLKAAHILNNRSALQSSAIFTRNPKIRLLSAQDKNLWKIAPISAAFNP